MFALNLPRFVAGEDLASVESQLMVRDETIAALYLSMSDADEELKQLRKELGSTKKAMAAAAKKELVGAFSGHSCNPSPSSYPCLCIS